MCWAANQFLWFAVDSAELNFPRDWLKEYVETEALVDGLLTETKVCFPRIRTLIIYYYWLLSFLNAFTLKKKTVPYATRPSLAFIYKIRSRFIFKRNTLPFQRLSKEYNGLNKSQGQDRKFLSKLSLFPFLKIRTSHSPRKPRIEPFFYLFCPPWKI